MSARHVRCCSIATAKKPAREIANVGRQVWCALSYVDAKVDASTMIEHRYFSLDTCDLMNTREYDL